MGEKGRKERKEGNQEMHMYIFIIPCTTSPSLTIKRNELCLSITFPLGSEPSTLIVTSDNGDGLEDTPSPGFNICVFKN